MLAPYLGEDLSEPIIYKLFMKFVAVELQAFYQFLHRPFGFKREKGQAEGNVSPLARILGKTEPLAKLVNYILCLFFLPDGYVKGKFERREDGRTFSMNEKIYFIVLWKVSSSTAWSPVDRWLITIYELVNETRIAIWRGGYHLADCYRSRSPSLTAP